MLLVPPAAVRPPGFASYDVSLHSWRMNRANAQDFPGGTPVSGGFKMLDKHQPSYVGFKTDVKCTVSKHASICSSHSSHINLYICTHLN